MDNSEIKRDILDYAALVGLTVLGTTAIYAVMAKASGVKITKKSK